MILIPASEFLMGIDPQQAPGAYADEQPQHLPYLPDYYPAEASVINAQWPAFVPAVEGCRRRTVVFLSRAPVIFRWCLSPYPLCLWCRTRSKMIAGTQPHFLTGLGDVGCMPSLKTGGKEP